MNFRFSIVVASGILMAACSKPPVSTGTNAPDQPSSPPTTQNAPSTEKPAAQADATNQPSAVKGEDKGSAPPTVPDSLKGDAYQYYGLGNDKPQKQTMTLSGDKKTYTGTHAVQLLSAGDGTASFKETQTGGPEGDIDQTISLSKDGIFIESVDPYVLKTPHVLQLPNDLSPGKTWDYAMELDMGAKTLKVTCTGKVVGEQTIKTKLGSLPALYVTSQGSGTFDKDKVQLQDEWWYEKGVGLVKSKETLTVAGKTQTVGVESTD